MKHRSSSLQAAFAALVIAAAFAAPPAFAQDTSDEHLAKQLANPVAHLMSVPFQFNWDGNIGPARNGHRS